MEELQLSLFANFDSGNMARYERVYKQQATSNTGTNNNNNNTNQSNPVATNSTNSTSTNSNGKSSINNTGKKNKTYIRVKSQKVLYNLNLFRLNFKATLSFCFHLQPIKYQDLSFMRFLKGFLLTFFAGFCKRFYAKKCELIC